MSTLSRRSLLGGIATAAVAASPSPSVAAGASLNVSEASPPDVERMIEIAFLVGTMPPAEREMALRMMVEIRDRRQKERAI
jgi:hypothetical protein